MEKLNKILEKVERKEGVLVVVRENEIEFVKGYYWRDNGDYSWVIRKFFVDETKDRFDVVEKEQLISFIKENLDEIKWFENETEFWKWFRKFYKDFKGRELEVCDIEECLTGLEERKGIMVVYSEDSVKFIKKFNNETRLKFSEVSLWYDGEKDNVYKWEDIYDEEEIMKGLMEEGKEIGYFKNYEDFVKWVINCWNK